MESIIAKKIIPGNALLQKVEQSIISLHLLFEGWLGGTIENTDASFKPFDKAFDKNFRIVLPSGILQNKREVMEELRSGWGKVRGLSITIESTVLLHEDTTSVLALYREKQVTYKTTNTRVSTVLFKKAGTELAWAFVQETFC